MKKFKHLLPLTLSATLLLTSVVPTYANTVNQYSTSSVEYVTLDDVSPSEIREYAIKHNKLMPHDLYLEYTSRLANAKTATSLQALQNDFGEYMISAYDIKGIDESRSVRANVGDVRIYDNAVSTENIAYDNISANDVPTFVKLALNISTAFFTQGASILAAILGSIPTGSTAAEYSNLLSSTIHDDTTIVRLAQVYDPSAILYDGWINLAQASRDHQQAKLKMNYLRNGYVYKYSTSTQTVSSNESENFYNTIFLKNKAKSFYNDHIAQYGNAISIAGPKYVDWKTTHRDMQMTLDFERER